MASASRSSATRTTMFKVHGLRELEAALDKLGFQVAAELLRDELVDASKRLVPDIVSAAPRDKGDLRRSIGRRSRISRAGRGRIAIVRVGVLRGRGSAVNQTAIAQEYGTKNHAAQPYMRPTFRSAVPGILDRFRFNMWERIRKVKAKR